MTPERFPVRYWLMIAACVLGLPLLGWNLGILIAATHSFQRSEHGVNYPERKRQEYATRQQAKSNDSKRNTSPAADLGTEQGEGHTARDGQNAGPEEVKWTDAWQARAAIITAGLTIVLAIVNVFQAAKLRESLDISRQSAEAAARQVDLTIGIQRALMINRGADNGSGINQESGQNIWAFVMRWENSGLTIGINCVIFTRVVVVSEAESGNSEPPRFNPDFTNAIKMPIAPGGKFKGAWQPVSHEDIVAIFEKRRRAFLYSRVEYEDIFGMTGRRMSEVCVEIHCVANPGTHSSRYFEYLVIGPQNSMS